VSTEQCILAMILYECKHPHVRKLTGNRWHHTHTYIWTLRDVAGEKAASRPNTQQHYASIKIHRKVGRTSEK
jgi:hypothetical protein